ncbi:MAG: OsmC family protein [Candidatus Lokiarchaeota archaeon]|nr:OsmC family protein [Candidatus Harpocratesius repetitus]
MKFHITLKQREEDRKSENLLKRVNTLFVADNIEPISIQLPIVYGGPTNEDGKNVCYTPEDLFLGAVSGCLYTTFSVVATNSNLKYESIKIETEGNLEEIDDVKRLTEIHQKITLIVPPKTRERKARKVLEIAEKRCALGNSIKSKITNEYIIIVQE